MDELNTKIKSIKTEKTLKVRPENIKKDVSIFGITGTYTSDANATASDILENKTAYVNGNKIIGTYVATPSYPPDWSELGYETTPQAITTDFNYAKSIQSSWDVSTTDMQYVFYNNKNIIYFPYIDTSNVTNMQQAIGYCQFMVKIPLLNTSNVTSMKQCFESCSRLVEVPQFNTSKVTTLQNCFNGCTSLSNESLNNILAMCINTTSAYTRTKSLYEIGLREASHPSATIQSLSNYTAFTNAGWTIGY